MKQVFLALVYLSLFGICKSQSNNTDPVIIKAELLDRRDSSSCSKDGSYQCYNIKLEVFNNQKDTLYLSYWTCPISGNWKSSTNSISFSPPNCTASYVTHESLPPNKSRIFNGIIHVNQSKKSISCKIGFQNFLKEFEPINLKQNKNEPFKVYSKRLIKYLSGPSKGKIYWSNSLTIAYPTKRIL